MSDRQKTFPFFILLIGDLGALYAALFLMLAARYPRQLSRELIVDHLLPFSVIFVGWLIILYALGFYDRRRRPSRTQNLTALLQALLLAGVFAIGYFYFIPTITPKRNLIFTLLIFGVLFHLWRRLAARFIAKGPFRARLALLGRNEKMAHVEQVLKNNPNLGFDLVLARRDLSNLELIKTQLERSRPDIIVTSANPRSLMTLLARIGNPHLLRALYVPLAEFLETIEGKIPIEIADATALTESLTRPRPSYQAVNRIIDLFLALLGGLLTVLLFLPVSAAIKISDGGSVFYRQRRIGKDGRPFTIIKFRTMVADAESAGPQWTERDDRRITAVGRFLRRSYIDELPQFINILAGEMSVVGPRPERPEFVSTLKEKIPFYNFRHLVKPGVTGWAQLSYPYARSIEDSIEKTKFDLYYIKHRSLLFDLTIILQTIRVIFGHQNQ